VYDLQEVSEILFSRGRLNVPQAAVFLNMHPATLHVYLKEGYILGLPIGRRIFILKEELLRYNREGKRDKATNKDPEQTSPASSTVSVPQDLEIADTSTSTTNGDYYYDD
jgi:hypothetical protein